MTKRYAPGEIEPKWQAYWEAEQTFRTPEHCDGPKKYILDMFPYPSGTGLHVGHPEGYTATDIVARYHRARGACVLHPMGWDAFGLPAEQHAIRTGTHPKDTTYKNIKNFRRQLKMLGFSYDWSREVDTTDIDYVKWTQWIFLKLFHRGLAYQDEIAVNWCPALGTVLSNEEVIDGRSEIGGHPVERAPLRQWMLKITAYADRLLDGLAGVNWPDSTRSMQREWIGRSEGAQVTFGVHGSAEQSINVFTTRPDTLFGATFMVLAPEHPLVDEITADDAQESVAAYVQLARNKSDLDRKSAKEKSGVFTGGYATNPVNGARVPIWIADYVLMGYGTGAIMAVPAHDERDFAFASAHGISIVQVVSATANTGPEPELEAAFCGEGFAVNSGDYDGLTTAQFKEKITSDLEAQGLGEAKVQFKLRDWVFSRQRYWGEPFPIYFPVVTEGDPRAGDPYTIIYDQAIAVSEDALPVRLPDLDDYHPGDDPAGVLARAVDWRFFQEEGKWYARETNTMPQWAGSCWYYLRFMDPHNGDEAWSAEAAQKWLPIDLYMGGTEHAVLHLLYARFWHQVLFDEGLVPCEEPFTRLVHQGIILGAVEFTRFVSEAGASVSREHVTQGPDGYVDSRTGAPVLAEAIDASECEKGTGGEFSLATDPEIKVDARAHKMSKSRGNVVNPDDIVSEYGADTLRLYEMFLGPLEASKPWSTSGINGVRRFLDRSYILATKATSDAVLEGEALRAAHRTIRTVGDHIERLRLNTAISAMMVYVNELSRIDPVPADGVETLAKLLHPFAPHLGEEMWEMLGHTPSIQATPWPEFDPALCEESTVELPVQVNGKVRAKLHVAKDCSEADALEAAKENANIAGYLSQGALRKVIYVPGRILNLIVA